MIYCESPTLEQWVAPPQENFPRPTWTKLRAAGILLSNSVEFADWEANPVQPIVCEACWNSGCVQAGLTRIVRLGDYLLWLTPGLDDIGAFWRDQLSEANFIREAVLMPVTTWASLRERFPRLPAPELYPLATRGDVAALWLREMPETVRVTELGGLAARLQGALASDPLDMGHARGVVRSMVEWVRQGPGQPAEGEIIQAQACGGTVNTFYLDGRPFAEWPAFIVERSNSFTLGAEWVFVSR